MDVAIVVDENVNQILIANVHLNPSDTIETSQTGTRHRTAHRVSVETELDVIAVSDESGIVKVFSYNLWPLDRFEEIISGSQSTNLIGITSWNPFTR